MQLRYPPNDTHNQKKKISHTIAKDKYQIIFQTITTRDFCKLFEIFLQRNTARISHPAGNLNMRTRRCIPERQNMRSEWLDPNAAASDFAPVSWTRLPEKFNFRGLIVRE